jgi:hypothetical protein
VKARIVLVTLALLLGEAPPALAVPTGTHSNKNGTRAPSNPPLLSSDAGSGGGEDAGAEADLTPQGETDPLVSNGLGSPTCKGPLAEELSDTSRRNCETSGFVAAPAPTGDYGIDVHIDTGLPGLSSSWWQTTVQDFLVALPWTALVWSVHALVVMVEWCFTLDLLDSSAAAGLSRGLRQSEAAFTAPWLPLALAVASVLALYHGLVRRRVAETVGETVLMVAMMVGGLWVIADPVGTVGALGEWANQASLGTLAVAARGAPTAPGRALGTSLQTVFAVAIEGPWCYLEFGNVAWCREPARLDPALHATALKIADEEAAQARCETGPPSPLCEASGESSTDALEHSSEMLRDARSNGAIFLALPANGPARNSINAPGSLLRAICASSQATACRGAAAAQAEFRTGAHTTDRLGGLLLIAAGLLGMLLLLGFVASRLLASAIFALLYLLLTPAMVLAPAFGEGGRTLFRRWAGRLLGAVVSKLLFSFLLGVMLAVLTVLSDLTTIGWWTQWLLMSAFWWGAYSHRHQALGLLGSATSEHAGAGAGSGRGGRRSVLRRVSGALETRKGMAAARWVKQRWEQPAPSVEERQRRAVAHRRRAKAGADEQVRRTLEREHREAGERLAAGPQTQRRLSDMRTQLWRVHRARDEALAGGNERRASKLSHRGSRIEGQIAREQSGLDGARRMASRSLQSHVREESQARERFLDEQAALPAAGRSRAGSLGGPPGEHRDYAALASLAGHSREEYERMDPRRQREARLQMDSELALRAQLGSTAESIASGDQGAPLPSRERRRADREFEDALERRMRDAGQRMPPSRRERSPIEQWREQGRTRSRAADGQESSVLRDAREVAARRKRQLGRDRP